MASASKVAILQKDEKTQKASFQRTPQANRQYHKQLHTATLADDVEKVTLLLEKGLDIAAQDIDGATALHLAAQNGLTRMVQLLLELGANPYALNQKKFCATAVAAQKKHFDVVRLLIERIAYRKKTPPKPEFSEEVPCITIKHIKKISLSTDALDICFSPDKKEFA